MEKLLDKEVHQLIKTPLISPYYTNNPPIHHMKEREGESLTMPTSPFIPGAEGIATDCSELNVENPENPILMIFVRNRHRK